MSDSATPWTVTRQAPLSMGFPRQEYWSGVSFQPPGNPYPGIKPVSLASLALCHLGSPDKYIDICIMKHFAVYLKLTEYCKSIILQLNKQTKEITA